MITRLYIFLLVVCFGTFAKAETPYIRVLSGPGIDSASDFVGVNALARAVFSGKANLDGFAAYIYPVIISGNTNEIHDQLFRSTTCMFRDLTEFDELFRKDEIGIFIVKLRSGTETPISRSKKISWKSMKEKYDYGFANFLFKTQILPRFGDSAGANSGLLFSFKVPIEQQDTVENEQVFWLPFENSEPHVKRIFNELERLSTREKFEIVYGSTGWRFWSNVRSKLAAIGTQISLRGTNQPAVSDSCE